MKFNIGSLDRAMRLLLAIILIFLFYTNILRGVLGVIGLIIALSLTVTSLISFCPIYKFLKINTIRPNKEKSVSK